jgi:hypothetical protein
MVSHSAAREPTRNLARAAVVDSRPFRSLDRMSTFSVQINDGVNLISSTSDTAARIRLES